MDNASKLRTFLSNKLQEAHEIHDRRKGSHVLATDVPEKLAASQPLNLQTSSVMFPAPVTPSAHPQPFKFEDAATLRASIMKLLRESDPLLANDVINAYSRYRSKISSKSSDDLLSEDDFIYFQAFRRFPLFLFDHTDLAISVVGVTQSRFVRFCEVLMPLAAKYNAAKIHRALCKGKEFLEPSDFRNYVDLLKDFWDPTPEDGAMTPEIEKAIEGERLLFAKVTGMGRGCAIITDQNFVYREIISQNVVKFPYSKILDAEPCELSTVGASLLRNVPASSYGIVLKVQDQSVLSKVMSKQAEESNKFRLSGKLNVRDAVLEFVHEYMKVHRIVPTTPSVSVRGWLMQNTWMDIVRAQALLKGGYISRPSEILKFINMDEAQIKEYVSSLEEAAGLASFSLSSLTSKNSGVDPETLPIPIIEGNRWEFDSQGYHHKKEYLEDVASLNQPLDINVLRNNLAVLHYNSRIIQILRLLERRLRFWENPLTSAAAYIFNVILVLNDWVKYTPAIFLFLNSVLILSLNMNPDPINNWLNEMAAEVERQKAKEQQQEEVAALDVDSFRKKTTGRGLGTFYKEGVKMIAQVKKIFKIKMDTLEELQNDIGRTNYRLLQVQALYTWVSPDHSKLLLAGSIVMTIALFLIPFRFIWGAFILVYFTTEITGDGSGNGFGDRFLRTLPAADPPVMNERSTSVSKASIDGQETKEDYPSDHEEDGN
eukprot:TRINITY_DN1035_c0_g1_i4.p1 TRINITY_DN1035_c0_g1~~TRINITY_DN1035_c0_g1_i4.p1  ORF type:complete len:713 (+),score=186.38 TRINITY_DN1035_c0_g1_i4:1230-3368(+)